MAIETYRITTSRAHAQKRLQSDRRVLLLYYTLNSQIRADVPLRNCPHFTFLTLLFPTYDITFGLRVQDIRYRTIFISVVPPARNSDSGAPIPPEQYKHPLSLPLSPSLPPFSFSYPFLPLPLPFLPLPLPFLPLPPLRSRPLNLNPARGPGGAL